MSIYPVEHTWFISFLQENGCTHEESTNNVMWWNRIIRAYKKEDVVKSAYIKDYEIKDTISQDTVEYFLTALQIPEEEFIKSRTKYLQSLGDFDDLIDMSLKTPPKK